MANPAAVLKTLLFTALVCLGLVISPNAGGAEAKSGDARVGYRWEVGNNRLLMICLDSSAPIEVILNGAPNGACFRQPATPYAVRANKKDYTYRAVFYGVPDGQYRLEIPDQKNVFMAYLELKSTAPAEGHPWAAPPLDWPRYAMVPAVKSPAPLAAGEARMAAGKGIPGFFMPEVYRKNGEYWVRDAVQNYKDDRRRYFWVDRDYICQDALDYRLGNRGGTYVFEVVRYRGHDFWKPEAGMESHRVEFIVPGYMDEPGEIRTPPAFVPHDNFIDRHTEMLPPYTPISGKISVGLRYSLKYTLEDVYQHGASLAGPCAGEQDPAKLSLTDGQPYADIPEEKFQQIPDDELRATAKTRGGTNIYLTDFEFWSMGLRDERTARKMYTYAKALRDAHPATRLADCFRPLIWNKSFRVSDEPRPLDQKFLDQYKHPESVLSEAFRTFKLEDGTNASMRDVYNLQTIDCYSIWATSPGRENPIYHLYSVIHDARIARKLARPGSKTVFFCWPGNDGDVPVKLYHKTSEGWVWQYVRKYTSYSWMETIGMISFIAGDGYHPWHDCLPSSDDPDLVNSVDYKHDSPNLEGWEPDSSGAASPIKPDLWSKCYPREPQWYVEYAKLGEYKVKQVDDILAGGYFEDAQYSVDGGKTWLNTEGEPAILYRAAAKEPIVMKKTKNGKSAIFAVNPFAKGNPRIEIQVRLSDEKIVPVTMTGKWPTLLRF